MNRLRRPSLRRFSLRGRLMLLGVSGVALALGAGGLAFYTVLTLSVDRTVDAGALAAAGEVARLVDTGTDLPRPLPVSGAQVIQVVDDQGRVAGGSVTADRLTPLLRPDEIRRALAGEAVVVSGNRVALAEPLRVRAVSAGPAATPSTVIVAVPVGDVLAGRVALRRGLLLSYPVVVAALAAVAWRAIGITLRPVEELRRGAERISGAGRDERLPVPVAADEIRSLAVTLNGMLDRLAGARLRQRSFVADAAHELRSPLASIRTQLDVAEHLGDGGTLPRDLRADVDRLSALVEDLLFLARASDDRRTPASLTEVAVVPLLAEVAAGFADARVPVTVGPGSTSVRADPDELRRAVRNLVDNAVRHARSRVELAAAEGVISVCDDGPGIPEADRERVFNRFTRLDDARDTDAGGSGLGLAIVRELVGRAGGTVGFAEPGPGWSLRVEIRLPPTSGPTRGTA